MGKRNRERVQAVKLGLRLPYRQELQTTSHPTTPADTAQRLYALGLASVHAKLPLPFSPKPRPRQINIEQEGVGGNKSLRAI